MNKILLLPVLALLVFTSCRQVFGKRVRGNGNVKTETRTAGQFSNINVSGNINVYVSQDSVSSIKVEADENLQEYIIVENDGGTLDIHSRSGYNLKPSKHIKVYISNATFIKFNASGACDIYTENRITGSEAINISLSGASNVNMDLKAPKISASLSGAGDITLKGETKDLEVEGSGSTDIRCFDLLSENTSISLSGAGSAEVFASVKLDVHVSGAADVKYKGNATVSQQVSGAGSVKKVQ